MNWIFLFIDDDENFKENFSTIRTKLGLCAQKDLLYDKMTIEEHLRMIAIIRGVAEDKVDLEIEDTIVKVISKSNVMYWLVII